MGLLSRLFGKHEKEPEVPQFVENDIADQMEYEDTEAVIDCEQCDGHYKLRDGKYGVFAGCSNYPRCKSTKKLYEYVLEVVKQEGINIYQWDKECWKCKKPTPVFSYYLSYELGAYDEYLEHACPTVGIGDLSYIDQLLSQKHPTIQSRYSKTTRSSYMANTCIHCGALQGRNYVVDDPHEIIGELWHDHTMDKFWVYNIPCDNTGPLCEDIKRIYWGVS